MSHYTINFSHTFENVEKKITHLIQRGRRALICDDAARHCVVHKLLRASNIHMYPYIPRVNCVHIYTGFIDPHAIGLLLWMSLTNQTLREVLVWVVLCH